MTNQRLRKKEVQIKGEGINSPARVFFFFNYIE